MNNIFNIVNRVTEVNFSNNLDYDYERWLHPSAAVIQSHTEAEGFLKISVSKTCYE